MTSIVQTVYRQTKVLEAYIFCITVFVNLDKSNQTQTPNQEPVFFLNESNKMQK